jgi:hypothetical protein
VNFADSENTAWDTACQMNYRLKIRLAAEADVAEATHWYNQRQR